MSKRKFNTLTGFLTSKSSNPSTSDTVEFQGCDSIGDGGAATWKHNGITGQTPSQSPAQLGDALLNDGNGNQWALIGSNIDLKSLGFVSGDIELYLMAAINGGAVSVTISDSVTCSLTQTNAQTILKYINNIIVTGFVSFVVGGLEISLNDFIDVNNESATKMDIQGVDVSNISITGFNGVTGVAKNYLVTLDVVDTSNIEVGNYLLSNVTSFTGTGRYKEVAGCWKITSKTANTVTFKHTHHQASFPTMTITAGTMRPLKSILRWDPGSRGLAIYNCDFNTIRNVVLAGSFDISVNTPTDGPDDGLLVGDQANTSDTGSTQSRSVFTGSVFLNRVGVVEWQSNGLQCIGGSVTTNGFSTCSNGHRGSQSAGNGFVRSKFSSSCGNASSGYEAEAGGVMNAAGSISAGNAEQGVYAIGNGSVVFNSGSYSGGNLTHGMEAKDTGVISANTSSSLNNTLKSVTTNGGFVTVESGSVDGVIGSLVSGTVELTSATSSASYSIDESSVIKLPDGSFYDDWVNFPAIPEFENVTYTDSGTTATYQITNGVLFFKIRMRYTDLDTSDVSGFSVGTLPHAMSGRNGQVSLKIRSSTGIVYATTDNFIAEYNTIVNTIIITDQAGQLLSYNGGKILAAGDIELSGWYEPA